MKKNPEESVHKTLPIIEKSTQYFLKMQDCKSLKLREHYMSITLLIGTNKVRPSFITSYCLDKISFLSLEKKKKKERKKERKQASKCNFSRNKRIAIKKAAIVMQQIPQSLGPHEGSSIFNFFITLINLRSVNGLKDRSEH